MHEENLRQLQALGERIATLEKSLHGNGREGLLVIVDRIRQSQQFQQKIIYVIFVAAVGTAIQNLWPTVIKLAMLATAK